jgi:uncharacterized protein YciI
LLSSSAAMAEPGESLKNVRTSCWSADRLASSGLTGRFLLSGRKIPRDGGIILAAGGTKSEVEAIVKQDPFHVRGLAEFRIIEFRASQRADNVQELIAREPRR